MHTPKETSFSIKSLQHLPLNKCVSESYCFSLSAVVTPYLSFGDVRSLQIPQRTCTVDLHQASVHQVFYFRQATPSLEQSSQLRLGWEYVIPFYTLSFYFTGSYSFVLLSTSRLGSRKEVFSGVVVKYFFLSCQAKNFFLGSSSLKSNEDNCQWVGLWLFGSNLLCLLDG